MNHPETTSTRAMFWVRRLTFVQSFVGHAINVARAAFRDQPLHHRVDTGSPVRAPHAATVKTDKARLW